MSFNTAEFSRLTDNVRRSVKETAKDMVPNTVRQMATQVPWKSTDGKKATFNSISFENVANIIPEQGDYPTFNAVEGDELTKEFLKYGGAFNITEEMEYFNTIHSAAQGFTKGLLEGTQKAAAIHMSRAFLGEADAATIDVKGSNASLENVCADGNPLLDTAHSVNGSTTTRSNIVSGAPALSYTSWGTATKQLQEQTVNDSGESIIPNADTVVIPYTDEMMKRVYEITESSLVPVNETSGPTNAANFYKSGTLNVIALRYGHVDKNNIIDPTKAFRWLCCDGRLMKEALQYMVALEPSLNIKQSYQDNLVARLTAKTYFAFAAYRWQGIVGSLATA